MIDIDDLVDTTIGVDITFKEYYALQIKNLFVNQGEYPYFPLVGINLDLWRTEGIGGNFDVDSFKNYVNNYILGYKIPLKQTTISIPEGGIGELSITFTVNNEDTMTGGLF